MPDRDLLKERADADGNITVVEEYGEEEKHRLLQLRLARINILRKEQKLPELTEEEFVNCCRPKQITDDTVVKLVRKQSD